MNYKVYSLNKIYETWGDGENDFFVQLHCEIMGEGSGGGEAVLINVVSPPNLHSRLIGSAFPEVGRGYLLSLDYNEKSIIHCVQGIIDRSGADTWRELKVYMERYFDWV